MLKVNICILLDLALKGHFPFTQLQNWYLIPWVRAKEVGCDTGHITFLFTVAMKLTCMNYVSLMSHWLRGTLTCSVCKEISAFCVWPT